MINNNRYDYIIAGSGLSGLLLAYELSKTSLRDKKVLLVDRELKKSNDRTWCFWTANDYELDEIVYKNWDSIRFATGNSDGNYSVLPYRYKYIRGVDFYQYMYERLKAIKNFVFEIGDISEISQEGYVVINGRRYEADLIFNSIHPSFREFKYPQDQCYYLLQHFKGYFLETDEDVFDPGCATFMDFDIDQKREARFGYILPFSKREALVEYTLFSQNLLTDAQYEEELKYYISNKLKIKSYRILHEEFGIVPMTTYSYGPKIEGKIVRIGTFGGFVKPSSGFAFYRTHKRIRKIVKDLQENGKVNKSSLEPALKYKLYDNILLSIIQQDNTVTKDIFEKMFVNLPASLILKFLDEESSLSEDLRVIAQYLTDKRFFKASFREVTRMLLNSKKSYRIF